MNQNQTTSESPAMPGVMYFTSDQLAFLTRDEAQKHAKRLADNSISTMTGAAAESQVQRLSDSTEDDLESFLDQLTGSN